jgi:hypothetical protein
MVGINPTVTARALWLKTHPLPPAHIDLEPANSASASNNQQTGSKRHQPGARQGQNYETKPISESSSQ